MRSSCHHDRGLLSRISHHSRPGIDTELVYHDRPSAPGAHEEESRTVADYLHRPSLRPACHSRACHGDHRDGGLRTRKNITRGRSNFPPRLSFDSFDLLTALQITGYITIGLAAISVPLYLYQKWLGSRPDLTFHMYRRLKLINAADFLVCQAILLISGFALPDGIDDFGIMTICGTNTVSSSVVFSLGMILSFVWNCAMATMTVQWLLEQRVRGGSLRDRAPPWMLKILRKRSDSETTVQ